MNAEVQERDQQTARVTQAIATQVHRIQTSTEQAITAVDGITVRMRDMSGVAPAITTVVEEQGVATRDILRTVSEAVIGTGAITATLSVVTGDVQVTGSEAGPVLASVTDLPQVFTSLRAEAGGVLNAVRAA
ncbi:MULTISPECIES: hypothetical protein [unclassified Methylobacterium]|uniref:hypothetical protein n=1 Tax=unclassified Methylobacterium TaxID=2615210 RepID=UPI0011C1E3CB|nr:MULTISPECIES: hypothetical protein [unclassified Methylobacterium]QEE39472.1 hypothetical protein FVA80_11490 [Methylobacterium sp. WL1]TXN55245.1 hypothetical protein FV241_20595 [Methylobacterium sp. WL2]